MVRWNLILLSNGSAGVYWYFWNTNIGQYDNYSTPFYFMMQYLAGGFFSAPCSYTTTAGIQTWTCFFKERNGTAALWVWTPNEAGASYSVPSGYRTCRDLNGKTTTISNQQTVAITVQPLMFEGTTAPAHLTASVD